MPLIPTRHFILPIPQDVRIIPLRSLDQHLRLHQVRLTPILLARPRKLNIERV